MRLKFRVLGLPYYGPYGGFDGHKTYFSPNTDFWFDQLPLPVVLRNHGQREGRPQVIGQAVRRETDERGVWFQVDVDDTPENRRLHAAAIRGELRASSGAISHLVRIADDGEVLVWPCVELSLVDTGMGEIPSNPWAVALADVRTHFRTIGKDFPMWTIVDGVWVWMGEGKPSGPPPQEIPALRTQPGPEDNDQQASTENEVQAGDVLAYLQALAAGQADEEGKETEDEDDINDLAAAVRGLTRVVIDQRERPPAPAYIRQRGDDPILKNGRPVADAIRTMLTQPDGRPKIHRLFIELEQDGAQNVQVDEKGRSTRTLYPDIGEDGAYLIPAQYASTVIEQLRARTALLRAGVREFTMSSDTAKLPKKTGGGTAYWLGPNEEITESEPAYGEVELKAHKVACLMTMPRELMMDTSPDVESIVIEDLTDTIGLEIDDKGLTGSGTAAEPTGLENNAGITVNTTLMGDNGAVWDYDDTSTVLGYLEDENVDVEHPSVAHISHPRIRRSMRQLTVNSETNHYLLDPTTSMPRFAPWGIPFYTTTALSIALTQGSDDETGRMYFGRWIDFVLGMRKFIEIMVSDQAGNYFKKDQVGIRAIARVDFQLRHAEAFQVIAGCGD